MNSGHLHESVLANTIGHIVLKSPRAYVIKSHGDGFGSYIERLINVAYETNQSFSNIINTLYDLIDYIQNELERTYQYYQFSIIIGKDFDCDQDLSNHYALIEHTGTKILIFSSIGTSYKRTTTTINDADDVQKPLSW